MSALARGELSTFNTAVATQVDDAAVAANIAGTLVAEALASGAGAQVRIGMPSGILTVGAEVEQKADGQWTAHSGAFYRTARRLFDGRIYVPR